jgi:hypothetical protein
MLRYSYEEIKQKENLIPVYEFDDCILNLINTISSKVSSSNYIKTPVFQKKTKGGIKYSKPLTVIENDLDNLKKLQITLNKLSSSTYDKLKNEILILIGKIIEDELLSNEELNYKILNIICSQKMNIDVFVNLYKEILDNYELFKISCNSYLKEHNNFFDNIKIIDHNIDYEEYCKNNKINDIARQKTLFYTKLSKIYNLEEDFIIKFLKFLNNRIININENSSICEELCEHYNIIFTNSIEYLKTLDIWDELLNNVKFIRNIDKSVHKNITNKIIFKYMDILDLIKK